jgi:hypothetical protein
MNIYSIKLFSQSCLNIMIYKGHNYFSVYVKFLRARAILQFWKTQPSEFEFYAYHSMEQSAQVSD